MLREPGSYYENKRSKTLLKVKDFHDAEAIVTGYELGLGRNTGVLGALIIKWENPLMGTKLFKVGSGFNDDMRKNYKKLYPIGTRITIKYFELGKTGVARFPIFMHVREDE